MDTEQISKPCQFGRALTENALTQRLLECLVIGDPLKRATRRLKNLLGEIGEPSLFYCRHTLKKTADEFLDEAHLLVVGRGGAIPFDEGEFGIVTRADLATAKRAQ